jgi:hypothetical protein
LKLKNNQQQQLVNQDTLRPDTASHHYQAPKLHQTSNLQTLKPTISSLISVLPTKSYAPYNIGNLSNDYSQTKALESVYR